jgi:hypothetical protein
MRLRQVHDQIPNVEGFKPLLKLHESCDNVIPNLIHSNLRVWGWEVIRHAFGLREEMRRRSTVECDSSWRWIVPLRSISYWRWIFPLRSITNPSWRWCNAMELILLPFHTPVNRQHKNKTNKKGKMANKSMCQRYGCQIFKTLQSVKYAKPHV